NLGLNLAGVGFDLHQGSAGALVLLVVSVKKMKDPPDDVVDQDPRDHQRDNETDDRFRAQILALKANIVVLRRVMVLVMISHGQPPHTPGIPARANRKPAITGATLGCAKRPPSTGRRWRWELSD